MSRYDAWKTTPPPDSPEYDYGRYTGLPYRFDEGVGRWRDGGNWQLVDRLTALEGNDAEIERREANRGRF